MQLQLACLGKDDSNGTQQNINIDEPYQLEFLRDQSLAQAITP